MFRAMQEHDSRLLQEGGTYLLGLWHILQCQGMDGWMLSCADAFPVVLILLGARSPVLPEKWEEAALGGACALELLCFLWEAVLLLWLQEVLRQEEGVTC